MKNILTEQKLVKKITKLKQKLHLMDSLMEFDIKDLMEKYLEGPYYTKSFEHETIWRYFNQVEFATRQLMLQNGKDYYPRFEILLNEIEKFNDKWISLEKDKNGEFIDGSSKFVKLVKKLMQEFNFSQKVREVVGE